MSNHTHHQEKKKTRKKQCLHWNNFYMMMFTYNFILLLYTFFVFVCFFQRYIFKNKIEQDFFFFISFWQRRYLSSHGHPYRFTKCDVSHGSILLRTCFYQYANLWNLKFSRQKYLFKHQFSTLQLNGNWRRKKIESSKSTFPNNI